jgi:hypothetical protein
MSVVGISVADSAVTRDAMLISNACLHSNVVISYFTPRVNAETSVVVNIVTLTKTARYLHTVIHTFVWNVTSA